MRKRQHRTALPSRIFADYTSTRSLFSTKSWKIARTDADLVGTLIWVLEQARKKSENLTQRLSSEISAVAGRKADHLAILNAEVLLGASGNGWVTSRNSIVSLKSA